MTRTRIAAIAAILAIGAGGAGLALHGLDGDHDHGAQPHGHRHVHLQEAGGKPMHQGAPQRRHLDTANCPAGSVFHVVNRGSVPIVQVSLRPSATTGGFDQDRLEGRILQSGQRIELDPGTGRFDVLVLRQDGVGTVALRQNPCRIGEVALNADASIAVR